MMDSICQRWRMWLLASIVCLWSRQVMAQRGEVQGVHDPSIIKEGKVFYLFCTGPGIPIRTSTDLFNWQRSGIVFGEQPKWRGEEFRGRSMWAPDISYFGGSYHLYYAISQFGRNRSIIGLATSKTLDRDSPDYRWEDRGRVIETQLSDDWNAIDPNLVIDEDKTPWLVMGSYWTGIKMRRIDGETGLLSEADTKLYSLASRPERPRAVEAPFMIRHDGTYYLFVSFDRCCAGVNSTYKIMVGRSKAVTGPFVDRESRVMTEGGATLVLESQGNVRGPGHCAILSDGGRDWLIHHFYDAENNGRSALEIRPITWDAEGWPVAGEPIARPVVEN
jgi:arabinan endo-1,5-alpha-L-arabinosidase